MCVRFGYQSREKFLIFRQNQRLMRPDDNDGLRQLRNAGAWLTLDPQAIAACATN